MDHKCSYINFKISRAILFKDLIALNGSCIEKYQRADFVCSLINKKKDIIINRCTSIVMVKRPNTTKNTTNK